MEVRFEYNECKNSRCGAFVGKDEYKRMKQLALAAFPGVQTVEGLQFVRYCYMHISNNVLKMKHMIGKSAKIRLQAVLYNATTGFLAFQPELRKNFTDTEFPLFVMATKPFAKAETSVYGMSRKQLKSAMTLSCKFGILIEREATPPPPLPIQQPPPLTIQQPKPLHAPQAMRPPVQQAPATMSTRDLVVMDSTIQFEVHPERTVPLKQHPIPYPNSRHIPVKFLVDPWQVKAGYYRSKQLINETCECFVDFYPVPNVLREENKMRILFPEYHYKRFQKSSGDIVFSVIKGEIVPVYYPSNTKHRNFRRTAAYAKTAQIVVETLQDYGIIE